MKTHLLVPELDQIPIVGDDLVSLAFTGIEQLRQSEPLSGHLVPVVGIDELVVVDAVGRVAFHSLDRGLAGVEGDDVVHETLARGGEGQGLGGIGFVVVVFFGLAHFEFLAWCFGGQAGEIDFAGVFVRGHFEGCGCEGAAC